MKSAISQYDADATDGAWLSTLKTYSDQEIEILDTLTGYIDLYFDKMDETIEVYQELQYHFLDLTYKLPAEITKRQVEFKKFDIDTIEKCEGRHWQYKFKYLSFEDCTEKLYDTRYTQGELAYLELSTISFQWYLDLLQDVSNKIENRRNSLLEIKSTLQQLNIEMKNLEADTTPIVEALPDVPSGDEMILEPNDSYKA